MLGGKIRLLPKRALGLAHAVALDNPLFRWLIPRMGAIPAEPEVAYEALEEGFFASGLSGRGEGVVSPLYRAKKNRFFSAQRLYPARFESEGTDGSDCQHWCARELRDFESWGKTRRELRLKRSSVFMAFPSRFGEFSSCGVW